MSRGLVLFDLDGTLVDTAPDIARALGVGLREVGVEPPPLDVVKRMVGDGARELIRRALAAQSDAAAQEETALAGFLAAYRKDVCVDSHLYPGARETLDRLAAAGVAAAVVTNKPGDLARRLLTTLGVAGELAAIVGDGDGFPRKPDPAAALALIERVGTTPAQTVVVGDGIPDMRLARGLGVTAIAATWGYVPADLLAAESPALLAGSFEEAARKITEQLTAR